MKDIPRRCSLCCLSACSIFLAFIALNSNCVLATPVVGGFGGLPGMPLPPSLSDNLRVPLPGAQGGTFQQPPLQAQTASSETMLMPAQAQAISDGPCPGHTLRSTAVGSECWAKVWERGGCIPENVPPYEQWHDAQTLEILIADVAQWASLPDDRHRRQCHGAAPSGNAPASAQDAQKPSMVGKFAVPLRSREELVSLVQQAGPRPIVLEFWSETCGFCGIMFPVFELLAEKYGDRCYFRTVDVQSLPEVADIFQVMGLPAFKAVIRGQLFQQVDGADTGALERMVEMSVQEADREDSYLTREHLHAFLQRHDPALLTNSPNVIDSIIQQSGTSLAQVLQELEARYGARPTTVGGLIQGSVKPVDSSPQLSRWSGAGALSDLDDDQLAVELRMIQQEMFRRAQARASASSNPCAETRSGAARDSRVERLVILGGGPAGLTAALYAARAGLCPLVVSPAVGGQLMAKGVDVENFPGVTRSLGSAIIQDMRAQALSHFVEILDDSVTSVSLGEYPFGIVLNSSTHIRSEALIVATGANSRWLGVKGEDEFRGRGVSSCAACDGPLFRGKQCAVIGGGDAAVEEAMLLARICSSVHLVHRRDQLRAGHLAQQRILSHKGIEIIWNSTVQEFVGELGGPLKALLLANNFTGESTKLLSVQAAFVAIGHDPNTGFLRGQADMDGVGYLQVMGRSTRTSVAGVFAAGDVADPSYHQAVTSAGSGASAAMDAERWLSTANQLQA